MHTAQAVARLLAQDAAGVASHLLPAGREKGGEWCVGSLDGEAGESLKVRLTGPRAGVWADFASDEDRGDLLDLWAKTRRLSVSDAMREAAQYLGLRDAPLTSRPIATVKAPKRAHKATDDLRVWQWLTQARKLPQRSLEAYRVGALHGVAVLPAFTPDGQELQYLKYRDIEAKKFWSEAGGEPCLFGWQAIPPDAREVTLCEGEMDAIALHSYGWPALSPTNGAGNLGWIDAEFDNLARFDTIHIAYDMDDAGQSVVGKIAERLGPSRCRLVSLPRKDANACLMADIDGEEVWDCFRHAKTFDPPELVGAETLAEEVVRLIHLDGPEAGVRLPWDKASDLYLFRPGEVTILAGSNNSGKSQMVGQFTLKAMQQGERCCIASMEFAPAKWLRRLAVQATAMRMPSADYIRAVHRWYQDKLWAFAVTGTAKTERTLEVFAYAAQRYGVRWFVVDNLAKCGMGEDDYNGQKAFVDRLTDFARDTDTHIVLVHHLRKGDSDRLPDKNDVKGAGGITDMADNVLLVWRNRRKEEARKLAEQAEQPFDEAAEPDARLIVDKQRNGDDLPTLRLWYSLKSYQFLEGPSRTPKQYVVWSAIEGAA